jgi:hypothetical protein
MLLAVCSLKGSPGVTTTCLALAAHWPGSQQPVVVEADPAGGDLLARFRLAGKPSLVTLAAAIRHSADPGLLWRHAQRLPAGLPVVIGPVGANQARAALRELATNGSVGALRRGADQPGTVVIADCGRVDPDSPVLPVIRSADVMLLLARARDEELAHVADTLHHAGRWNRRPGFVLVGDGYATAEVQRALRIGVAGRIPYDPKGAAVLCGQQGASPQRSRIGTAAARLACDLAASSAPPPPAPPHTDRAAPVGAGTAPPAASGNGSQL